MKCRLNDAEQDDVLLGFFRGPGAAHGVSARIAKALPRGEWKRVHEVYAERKFDSLQVQTLLPILASDMRHVGGRPSVAEWVAKLPLDPEVTGSTPSRCKPFCPF